jgi:hypothetical protein
MKISAISAMSYGNGLNKTSVAKQNKAMSTPINREVMEYPKGYMPYQINFSGGGSYAKLPGIKLLKTVKDLPCLYCAQKMVSSNVIDDLSANNATITKTLGELSHSVQKKMAQTGTESPVFTAIINGAKKNPLANSLDFLESLEAKKQIVPDAIKKMATRQMTGTEYAQKAISTISEYEDGLMPVEKQVFQMIKDAFNKNPNQSISQIMSGLRTNKLGGFEVSQTKILDEIAQMASSLSRQTKQRVLYAVDKSKTLLNESNNAYPFKRKKFIEILNRIPISKQDVNGMNKIIEKAETIPTSSKDAGAFIAKYSNRNIPTGKGLFVSRSDSEIVQRLLDPSRQSVEHIRPQVTFKTSGGSYTGPKDVIQNLALAHKQCNSDRSDMSLEQYMNTINPKAKESIQKHIDFLIKEIKAGRLEGLEKYPEQLQETFANETNGRLKLDISEIKDYMDKFMAKKNH